jgi:hypothetical protein
MSDETERVESRVLLWIAWTRVAIKNEREAAFARDKCVSVVGDGATEGVGDWLNAEFDASLVVITACPNALEALYGGLRAIVPGLVKPDRYRPDWEKVLLSLGSCFEIAADIM